MYAKTTTVSIEKSQGEIRKILSKYGASNFAFAEMGTSAVVVFEMSKRRVKFNLPMPLKPDSQKEINKFDQTCRSRWRALALAIKAKLECVKSNITNFEQEFMAHIVLPSGQTVGEVMAPQISDSYSSGKMPPLLGYR